MEKKLKEFGKIICMDGTHCTNRKGMDLTIMLVKDDKNAGFPVAFFLTSRLDQVVQERFLGALKKKVEEELQPEYFMSDPKYYKAWVKVMKSEPRRLLCTWYVIKNWNLQGRNKIKNAEIKKAMKNDLKKILNETKVNEFVKLSNEYFDKLKHAQEIDFLDYLQKYYFQDQKRMKSLNNLLKTNQIKRKTNITVEKLLDKIEDLVDSKMWQRILNMERPNANSYQDKVTLKRHKITERMDRNLITEVGFGEFQDFIESKRTIDEGTNEVDREAIGRMGNQEILNLLNELDFETYSKKLKTI
ncbi:hypothetical protein ILUMI_16277 [Ignelater luminosus]|uniref:ZSWIM1/3 RNaseH-like domain-containing protein n=1 Tax=Ignelater luminosus TaxID=2038154 RepID=A0A8K0CQM1_IGNLU|nr:hypothetical protein ILUMI_16277 [Ignelater luminosus]